MATNLLTDRARYFRSKSGQFIWRFIAREYPRVRSVDDKHWCMSASRVEDMIAEDEISAEAAAELCVNGELNAPVLDIHLGEPAKKEGA